MIYYGIISAAVLMFSVQFFFNREFERSYGSSLRDTLIFTAGSNIAGLIVLLLINGARLEYTPFSLIMAIITALDMIAYSFCSLKALGKINLSLYSVFAMLGGMALPFAVGIIFYNEELTAGKLICFAVVAVSLALTVKKEKGGKGYIYYAGVFLLNGMSGVLSTVFQQSPYEKTSAAGYSVLTAAATVLISAVLLPFVKGEKKKLNKRATVSLVCNGILSRVANWLLLIALVHLPASAQYPFVTGGVMIMSTVICYFTPDKPGKREIAAVALSFIGLLVLVFAP